MATWNSNSYDGRYLQLSISESVDAVNNCSYLTWTLTSTGGAVSYYSIAPSTITINGVAVYSKGATGWSTKVFPASKGSVSGSITVYHNSGGDKSISVGFSTRVYYSAAQEYGGSMTLSNINRSVPTVACYVSNLNTNGFTVSASSNCECNLWWYSLDGGGWTEFAWSDVSSTSKAFTGLSSATHSIRIAARRTYNYINGYSSTATADCIAPTISFSTSGLTASSVTITAKSSVACDIWQYSINGGSTWTHFSTTIGTSAAKTITGLTPAVIYSLKVRARKQSNGLYGTSVASSITTLGGSLLNSVTAFEVDVSNPVIALNWTIYNASYYHKLVIKNGSTTILTISGITGSVGMSNKSIALIADQRSTILNAMSALKSFLASFILTTYSDSTYSTVIGTSSTNTATISTTSSTSAPSFTNSSGFTYSDTNATTVAVTEDNKVFVKGYSSLTANVYSATAKNGASISKYSVKVGSKSVDTNLSGNILFGVIDSYGTLSLVVTATDSRGYSVSVTKNITVIDYADITIDEYILRRENEVEPTVQLKFGGSLSPVFIASVAKNTIQLVRYRSRKTGSSYNAWVNLTLTESSAREFLFETAALIGSTPQPYEFDSNSSYDIQINVSDELSSETITIPLVKGTPLVSFRSQKVGINKSDPQFTLDVNGDISASDNVYMRGQPVLGNRGTIESDTDFNILSIAGIYFFGNNGIFTNKPCEAVGFLEVITANNYVIQRFTTVTEGCSMYVRSLISNSTWTVWTEK